MTHPQHRCPLLLWKVRLASPPPPPAVYKQGLNCQVQIGVGAGAQRDHREARDDKGGKMASAEGLKVWSPERWPHDP